MTPEGEYAEGSMACGFLLLRKVDILSALPKLRDVIVETDTGQRIKRDRNERGR
jgi:hypothetical protein